MDVATFQMEVTQTVRVRVFDFEPDGSGNYTIKNRCKIRKKMNQVRMRALT